MSEFINRNLLLEIFRNLPRGFLNNNQELNKILINDYVYELDGLRVNLMSNWNELINKPRSLQRKFHMNSFVGDILGNVNGNSFEKVELACNLCEHWANIFNYENSATQMAFHDETTARRVCFWLRIYIISILNSYENIYFRMELIIRRELNVLISDEFHAGLNNHGMFQKLTLLYLSVLGFCSKNVALDSVDFLMKYLSVKVSSDGVHLEHSPAYHYIIGAQYYNNLKIISEVSRQNASDISNILKNMGRYAVDILMPNGEMPPIGDTSQTKPANNFPIFFGIDKLKVAQRKWSVFKDAGYAIFKSDIEYPSNCTYSYFSAGHHGEYHKHADDLSLIIYRKGWIICESGPYGYEYSNMKTQMAYSNIGHNNVIFNKNLLTNRSQGVGAVSILRNEEFIDFYRIEGENHRNKEGVHIRRVDYNKNGLEIKISDYLKVIKSVDFAFIWHTPLMPIIRVDGNDVVIDLEDKAKFEFYNSIDLNFRVIHGDKDPFYKSFFHKNMGLSEDCYGIIIEGKVDLEFTLNCSILIY